MPTRVCGGEEPSANRMRPLAHDGAHATAAVSRARIKSSYQPSTLRACVGKAPLSFPATVPSTTSDAFHSQTPIVSSGSPVCSRSRACASARLDATHARERHSERRWHHGTTIYIHTRATVRVGRSDLCLSLSLLCGRGNAQSSSLALRKGLSRGTGTPKRKEAHVGAFPTASTEARAPSTTPARPPARRPRTLHKQTR
jgi:hypothetical protein